METISYKISAPQLVKQQKADFRIENHAVHIQNIVIRKYLFTPSEIDAFFVPDFRRLEKN
jgi:hypothetical protein